MESSDNGLRPSEQDGAFLEQLARAEALAAGKALVERERDGLRKEVERLKQEKSDLIHQVIDDADKMMARDAEVERLRDALRLFLRIDRLGDAVWASPDGRAEALAMFDEFGASNWPDMRGIAKDKALDALGEGG